jgi:hypothetical protein
MTKMASFVCPSAASALTQKKIWENSQAVPEKSWKTPRPF